MRRSKIVLALAEVASQGRYTVDPAGARKMNAVFDAAARLINELEAEENNPVENTADPKGESSDS